MSATRFAPIAAVILVVGTATAADPAVTLAETFDDKNVCRVEVKSNISGKISLPVGEGKPAKVVDLSGSHHFQYDERPLTSEDPAGKKLVRAYRTFEFSRTIGGQEQKAVVRPDVRRMVVLRSDKGRKAPFSPDGPLTFDEIDVVKNDLFCPTLVAGLLPPKAVTAGARWQASEAAVVDLTDLDRIDNGGIDVEFVAVVESNKKKYAKLSLSGTVRGQNEDGPNRQQIDGTVYFDLEANRLSYLKLNGVHELLDDKGQATGKIEGSFTLTREASPKADEFTDAALKGVELKPTDEVTQLLYDNPDLGVKFLHPRRWRVGVVQGRQLVLNEPQGGWAKLTVLPAAKTPTAAAFQAEVKDFLAKEKVKLSPVPEPKRWQAKPAVDRFGMDVEAATGKLRMEFALLTSPEGGVTVDARLPEKLAAELSPDLDRVLKSLTVTKKIADAK
jgi:hypothetical protein